MEVHPVHPKEGSSAGTGPEQHHRKKASPARPGPAHHHVFRNLRPCGRWLRGLCIAAVVLGSVVSARAGDLTIRQIGAWGGSVKGIHVEQVGDQRIAYIGNGMRLVVLDVTDPANIIELSSVTVGGVITDLQGRDGFAFVGAAPPAWFCVVDVRDPAAPVLVASGIPQNSGLLIRQVEMDGTGRYAYVAEWDYVGHAIDISDPTAPVYWEECGGLSPFAFRGNLQYTVNVGRYGRVGVWEIWGTSGNCYQTLLGYVDIIPELQWAYKSTANVVLVGDYLYVTSAQSNPVRHSSIVIVDISNPEAPFLAGLWGDPTGESFRFGRAIAVSDGRLYWAGPGRFDHVSSRTLVILDIATDPTTPTMIGEYSSDASFYDLFVLGTTAYLGDPREGLTIVDCSDPPNPRRAGNYFSTSEFGRGALDGDKLYVTDEMYGVTTLDVSDPWGPTFVGKWETGTYTADRLRMFNWGIAVRDDLAYVAAGFGGLQVLDVSDPATPTLAGTVSSWPDGIRSVGLALAPDEPIVHLGTIPGAWIVNFDVSDLSNITDVGAVNIGGLEAKPLRIVRRPNGIAYVARETATATLVLSDAENPWLLNVGIPQALDVALDGDNLYSVNDSRMGPERSGLDIFSVPTTHPIPTAENQLAHYGEDPLTGSWYLFGYSVAVSNERAYVSLYGNHRPYPILEILDVSDPADPFPLAIEDMGDAYARDIILDRSYVYAITQTWEGAAGSAGVLVYKVFYPGDFDDDGDVDLRDYATLQRCFSGGAALPAGRAGADCLVYDFDEDDDVDGADYAAFRLEATEPR